MGITRRKFSKEFKVEAVRLIQDRGVSVPQAARDLDVNENVLRRWVRELTADPVDAFPGLGKMKPEQEEIARLQKEVAKLKMERDILKKGRGEFNRSMQHNLYKSSGGVEWQGWDDLGYQIRRNQSYCADGRQARA